MIRRRLLPFWILPSAWGLVGTAYDEAEAYYNLTDEDLERRLAKIRCGDDVLLFFRKQNDLDFKYRKIDSYTHDIRSNELEYENDENERYIHQIDIDIKHHKLSGYEGAIKKIEFQYPNQDNIEYELAFLKVQHEFGKLDKNAYEKSCATLKNEPWVAFIDSGFDPEKGIDGFRFELDYNVQWIEYLRLHGFVGISDEQVLEEWFIEVCRSNAQSIDPNITVVTSPFSTLPS